MSAVTVPLASTAGLKNAGYGGGTNTGAAGGSEGGSGIRAPCACGAVYLPRTMYCAGRRTSSLCARRPGGDDRRAMVTLARALEIAWGHHQAGRSAEAE